jgi:hypothetical protein
LKELSFSLAARKKTIAATPVTSNKATAAAIEALAPHPFPEVVEVLV